MEPSYSEVGTAALGRAGSRADIEARLPPPHDTALLDVSLTQPRAATYVTDAAAMQGSAAAKRDALNYRGHNDHYHLGYTFIPASVETYGYLGKPLVRYLKPDRFSRCLARVDQSSKSWLGCWGWCLWLPSDTDHANKLCVRHAEGGGHRDCVKVSPCVVAAETVHAGAVGWLIGRIEQC